MTITISLFNIACADVKFDLTFLNFYDNYNFIFITACANVIFHLTFINFSTITISYSPFHGKTKMEKLAPTKV